MEVEPSYRTRASRNFTICPDLKMMAIIRIHEVMVEELSAGGRIHNDVMETCWLIMWKITLTGFSRLMFVFLAF